MLSRIATAGLIAATGFAATLAGCQRNTPSAAQSVQMGTYRVALATPGGELPFGLTLEKRGDATVAYLLNGPERLEVTDVRIDGNHLDIKMPGYENRLIAEATGDQLVGEIELDKLNGQNQHVPLQARLGDSYRFFPQPGSGHADLSGHWSVTFHDSDGTSEPAVGEFTQSQDVVTGTFLTTTGDHRYLAGQVKGDELYLSTFDGAHVFLYRARLGPDGALNGDFWSGLKSHETWNGTRNAAAALPDAYSLTAMKGGGKRLDFSFPDLSGKPVSDQDPQFKGKVLIVAVAGSWCPNCHDEAAFLAPLYQEYRAKGLEIVSLQFEHFGDFERAAAATQRFRQHYKIEYTTLIAGISDKDDASKRLPALQQVVGFPTTIFVDRKGVVRKIHTGFSGPATGEHYTQFVNEVKTELDQLLAES
jgi:thiol-disulfide isomerase/thioredoxin